MTTFVRVEKLMSLTRQEFVAALAHVGGVESVTDGAWSAALKAGTVTITFAALPSARLGGLLELPRAKVMLDFHNTSGDQQSEFLQRFDLAFQRGGG